MEILEQRPGKRHDMGLEPISQHVSVRITKKQKQASSTVNIQPLRF